MEGDKSEKEILYGDIGKSDVSWQFRLLTYCPKLGAFEDEFFNYVNNRNDIHLYATHAEVERWTLFTLLLYPIFNFIV